MTPKRTAAGDKRARKVQQRRKRLAQQGVSREQHAALVLERSGDPSFVQRRTNADGGRTLSWSNDTVGGAELNDSLEEQQQAFRDKFGRDLGPNDPLFFDPDADTPQEISEETLLADVDSLIDKAMEAGENPAYLQAWRDTGFLLTEHNMHLFSASDIDEWNAALERHWDEASFGPFDDAP
ncbi:hypothetical protein CH275_09440 [Rhodococcus sp. 06-235-1A]|uniref:hypothetical protein n=1 Tax=Rhodococcus sp. 06-235-1A TaxID=2022508 RepID=UPI000B9A1F4B|nr:hypothetical protein [Rhodococcus sp. 06-235-1A]OZD06437.1 hypothetical protein CH275_09440 [Rhodococcus sp. 06-235-1A]